jgi:cytochrome oxidase assembly protein ShyY1
LNIFNTFVASRKAATLAALIVIAIGCSAGVWQLKRADQKNHLGEVMQATLRLPILDANGTDLTLEEANQRRLQVRGQYLPGAAIWLDNRPRPIPEGGLMNSAQAGFYLMMPLRIAGKDQIIWINRGWAPRNNESRTLLPPIQTPVGEVSVVGTVFAPPGKVFELGKTDSVVQQPRIEQNFDLAHEAQLHGWQQLPFILREDPEVNSGDSDNINNSNDGLVRNWAPPTNGVDRHYAYAFQWFALALSGFLFWFITGLKQSRRQRQVENVSGDQVE